MSIKYWLVHTGTMIAGILIFMGIYTIAVPYPLPILLELILAIIVAIVSVIVASKVADKFCGAKNGGI